MNPCAGVIYIETRLKNIAKIDHWTFLKTMSCVCIFSSFGQACNSNNNDDNIYTFIWRHDQLDKLMWEILASLQVCNIEQITCVNVLLKLMCCLDWSSLLKLFMWYCIFFQRQLYQMIYHHTSFILREAPPTYVWYEVGDMEYKI